MRCFRMFADNANRLNQLNMLYANSAFEFTIYSKMNLAKRMQQANVCPYLLRNAVTDRPNQEWSIGIT